MTALCALILADRGAIDFYTPVARYWPEFAQNGKAGIEVRHLMSHSAGLAGWDAPLTVEDMYDWDKVTSLLAAQAPWWEPGTASGYHASTQGFLINEVVRRVTGKSLGTFLREEVAGPLGADFHIGLDPKHDSRVATAYDEAHAPYWRRRLTEFITTPGIAEAFAPGGAARVRCDALPGLLFHRRPVEG